MIDYQDQLKLQSYLDGELTEAESREVANMLARNADAAALLTELRQTNEGLAGFEEGVRLPESREFFWSKISHEIQRQRTPIPERTLPTPAWVRLRRFLMPATGLAVAGLLGLIVSRESGTGTAEVTGETALEDSGAFTYHDDTAGATLVWLSYPADNEAADDDDLNPE